MLKSALGYLRKKCCINEDDFTIIIIVITECGFRITGYILTILHALQRRSVQSRDKLVVTEI